MPSWTCKVCGLYLKNAVLPVRHDCQSQDPAKAAAYLATLPGWQLKRILRQFGIASTEDCGCDSHAEEMNQRGIEWCKANVPKIVGWMRTEAKKRGLPFIERLATWAVDRAIRLAIKGKADMARL